MTAYRYITLRECPELKDSAAAWFHSKGGVPTEAYLECMDAYLENETEYGCGRYEVKSYFSYLSCHRPYRLLRKIRLGIPVYGAR